MSKHLLLDLSFDICEKLFAKLKLKNFIVKQVFHWIYQKNIYDFNKMTNISLNNPNEICAMRHNARENYEKYSPEKEIGILLSRI